MSKYDILLKPTAIEEQWFEVPRITTCGVDKEIVRNWDDVVKCAKGLGYKSIKSTEKDFVFKSINGTTNVVLEEDGTIYIVSKKTKIQVMTLKYNKMVLFMLLLENKL